MTEKKIRYLVTTSDESTWKFDRPVIFLGEWCRLYDRRHIWENMDAIVAEPYGVDRVSKDLNAAQASEFEDTIFPKLCTSLNHYHGKQYSQRFWKIILGHWLSLHLSVILNRVKTLEQCLQKYQISGTTFFRSDDFSFTADCFSSSLSNFDDNQWNNILNEKILNLLEMNIPFVENIDYHSSIEPSRVRPSFSRVFSKWAHKYIGLFLSFFIRDNDAFIINSYLPLKEEVKLHLALRQLPQFWSESNFKSQNRPNSMIRHQLAKDLTSESKDSLMEIISSMLFELMPVCFLEDFSNLNNFSKKQRWPKNPKFIFTSSNFFADDVFKLWTANKVESGTKYYIGQHGNNNGTLKSLIGGELRK